MTEGGVFGYRVSGERGRYPPNNPFSARFIVKFQQFLQNSVILDYILTVSEKTHLQTPTPEQSKNLVKFHQHLANIFEK